MTPSLAEALLLEMISALPADAKTGKQLLVVLGYLHALCS